MEKIWRKPELIVILRGKPEEAVLGACKASGFPDIAAIVELTDCVQNIVNCEICSDVGGS